MNLKSKIGKQITAVAVLTFAAFSCETLDTENVNNPTTSQVLSSGSDLPGFLAGGFLTWWQANHLERPGMALNVTADAVSCSWGNFGMRRWSEEPRETLNNSSNEGPDYLDVLGDPYRRNHSAQFTANAVLTALEVEGLTTGSAQSDEMLVTSAYFLRGIARGYLALLFDRSFLTTPDTDLLDTTVDPNTYQEILAAAIADLDIVIARAATSNFTVDASFFNGVSGVNQDGLARLASSYAARFLAQSPRTEAENDAVDWAAVRDYALNGITENFAPIANGTQWFSYQWASTATYGDTWARADMRIMSALDPNLPSRYPLDGSAPPNPDTLSVGSDYRLWTDFVLESNAFPTSRGLWHFSTSQHDRSDSDGDGEADEGYIGIPDTSGPMPVFVVEDNQMLLAEGYLRTGALTNAAAILNDDDNSRNARGRLPDVDPADADAIEAAIWHERFIETLNTGPGGQYFDRRRIGARVNFATMGSLDGLQEGTPAHFPIPATELELLNREVYTFGGANDLGGLGQ